MSLNVDIRGVYDCHLCEELPGVLRLTFAAKYYSCREVADIIGILHPWLMVNLFLLAVMVPLVLNARAF